MKIAVASQNRREVTGHAGRCRRFWLFETSDPELRPTELLELPKEQCFHDLAPAIPAPLEDIDVLLVGARAWIRIIGASRIVGRRMRCGCSSMVEQ